VLAIGCDRRIPTDAGPQRADELAAQLPRWAWQQLSAGRGAKGERFYEWAWIDHTDRAHRDDPLDTRCWSLLIRRHRDTGELAFYRCYSPAPVPLRELVRVAGRRWTIEEALCATRRLVASPVQSGGTRREVSGSDGLPGAERLFGDKSMPENQRPGPGVRDGALSDPRNMVKA